MCSIGVLIIIIIWGIFKESRVCLGLPIIKEAELTGYIETKEFDISKMRFDGEDIAVDFPNNSIFISQPIKCIKNVKSLVGVIETANPTYSLAILETECIDDLTESVQNGAPLTLIIKEGNLYQKVNLIITTLPVMYLDFESESEDEESRNVNKGKMTLWNNYNLPMSYLTMTSNAEWRLRGNSTRSFSKKAWKLNLRNNNGENNSLDLLGLGSDDDWILNPMSMDDTFVKEKLTQELWNQLAKETSNIYKMSQGEYIELFINGAYQGLYLLQRRVDAKYLEINQEKDVLMKGINTWEAESIYDAYEIISSPYENEETFTLFNEVLNFEDDNTINVDNFIDTSLFIQFISGSDNYGYKNTFYLMKQEKDSYELYLVPWDTDLSLGVTWGYDYEDSIDEIIERREMSTMREHIGNIDMQIADKWNILRKNTYAEENIFSIYSSIKEELKQSGAVRRDEEQWGLLHEGEDNWENLEKFIRERLVFLDKYYAKVL